MVLLGFSVAVVMATLFNKDNRAYTAPYNIPPGGAFVHFWFLIIWLAMMEGGQGALVGLQPVDKSLYATTHPRTLKNTKLSHKGDNMERFIIGRQFLVVLVIFIINICGSAREEGVDPLGLPKIVNAIFTENRKCYFYRQRSCHGYHHDRYWPTHCPSQRCCLFA